MALIVQKFGGSSLADPDKLRRVADKIAARARAGDRVAVVVSAMGDTTDDLIEMARAMGSDGRGPDMDFLLATGEMVSAGLMAMALHARSVRARAMTGREAGIITDYNHTRARITRLRTGRIRAALESGEVVIVTGFQGVSDEDRLTTLGRGGSDLSAVALAKGLKADLCEIFTDVPGIFTADPRLVPASRVIRNITYEEALEMASCGAAVMQARSVEFAQKYRVAIRVRSTFSEGEGTMITRRSAGKGKRRHLEEPVISSVTGNAREAKVSLFGLPDLPGLAGRVFGAVADDNIDVDMIIQNVSKGGLSDLSFTVPEVDLERTSRIIRRLAGEMGDLETAFDPEIAKVSIVGIGMQNHPGVAATMFRALGESGINIEMISTSEIKISCVIRRPLFEKALNCLHEAFELGRG